MVRKVTKDSQKRRDVSKLSKGVTIHTRYGITVDIPTISHNQNIKHEITETRVEDSGLEDGLLNDYDVDRSTKNVKHVHTNTLHQQSSPISLAASHIPLQSNMF
jgi:hypothetical protein